MGTVIVKRAPRRPAPEIPGGELVIDAPPEIPQAAGGRWQQAMMILPMLGSGLGMAMMVGNGQGNKMSYLAGGMMGVSSLGMIAASLMSGAGQPKKAEMMAARREYLRHLAALRRRARHAVQQQRIGLFYRHPDPQRLWSTVDSHRLWERRGSDPDFGIVRVGVGPQSLATPLIPPETRPLEELEPMTAGALRRFLDAYSVVPDLPVALSIRGFGRVFLRSEGGTRADNQRADGTYQGGVFGGSAGFAQTDHRDGTDAHGLTRAMLAQLAVFHAPDDLIIAVCASPHRRDSWDWAKWLPHHNHPTDNDALGPVRLFATSAGQLEEMLSGVLAGRARFGVADAAPHVVVVLDGGDLADSNQLVLPEGLAGLTVLDLDTEPPRLLDRSMLVLETRGRERSLHTITATSAAEVGTADRIGVAEAEAIARRLAPLRLSAVAVATNTAMTGERGLADLLGIPDPERFDTAYGWSPRADRNKLRVPIGVGPDGSAIELDIKESAQDGMGPHGLLVGATGSGKSELLRTLVLGLAATHSSEQLNFVLVDFKGGATFASLDRLPHTSAVITNLEGESHLVNRMGDAITGEVLRRQELLRAAGNFANLKDYEKARTGGAALAPLASLFIVCDEFSELLTANPDFIEIFVQIGRVGRSIGMHLLLASQRLEEGRLRGLDTHLSYRIGLRTFSAMESRAVLGVGDAYDLPKAPGHGYLKFGSEPLQRFKGAYVSGSFKRAGEAVARRRVDGEQFVYDFSNHYLPVPKTPKSTELEVKWDVKPGESLMDVMIERMVGQGPPAHQVWLPPLDRSDPLDLAFGQVGLVEGRGLTVANPELRGALRVPVAVVDKPAQQLRDLQWVRLADGAAGHVAVAGGNQSGKSTLLRTLVTGLALTHTPQEVQVYCLDFGGGTLASLRELPHVGGVAGRQEAMLVRRTVGEVAELLNNREARFLESGIDSMASYRRLRAAGRFADDPYGDVFLVVDGWATLKESYEDLEPVITDITTRGLAYGVHVVAATLRWRDFRPAIADQFGTKLELRLGDPSDTICRVRKVAPQVPQRPGFGCTPDGLFSLALRPDVDQVGDREELVRQIAKHWSGAPAPRVRVLPNVYAYDRMPVEGGDTWTMPIGIADDLTPALVDFYADVHLSAFGESECGKSTLLRQIATTITRRYSPDEAKLLIVDPRRSLLGAVTTPHQLAYITSLDQVPDYMDAIAAKMAERRPPADVTPQEIPRRPWLAGRGEFFLIIDDYDIVVSSGVHPLRNLEPFLFEARDVGLHLITASNVNWSRASYDAALSRVLATNAPYLQMSADRNVTAPFGSPFRNERMTAGRGRLITRRGARLVQLADLPAY
ncbi:type VII secretion protein EccCa [Catellatospora tritici]|uniref:type VII secretion protein EccCa n=1 Tax=Catellatospora tritici TaxID=2851566 RepID=UPI001C2D32DA|nr:type VII secretion protein EccCa [Catellatospora tritici]MBV1853422.1 type VII secretion protein EccCa [Catellatospora tritici]